MSSACVCHIEGAWCFYCEMYSPLEEENSRLKVELSEWKTRAQEAEDLAEYLRERAAIASGWSIARKAQVDRLVGVLAELLSAIDRGDIEPSVVDIAREALEDAAQTSE